MIDYKKYFRDKKITLMGLGLLGRGVGDAVFLAKCGADLIVTDLKSKEELGESLDKLKDFKNIKYVLGEHKLEDFKDRDLIIKAAGIPLGSIYVEEARKNNIPVEMDASLFTKLSGVKTIGVTGTRGKSTVTHLLYEVLKAAGKKVHLGGNVRGVATLPLLEEVENEDIVLMELDSWQLQGFGESEISPNISVFTNFMPDHLNYYKGDMDKYFDDKSNIFKYQKDGDFLIAGFGVAEIFSNKECDIKSNLSVVGKESVPEEWDIKLLGDHNLENISKVLRVAEILGIDDSVVRRVVENFKGVPGRLEFVREVDGVKYYNDTTATNPDGAMAAIKAFSKDSKNKGRVVLLAGGADKNLDYKKFVDILVESEVLKELVLFSGEATDKILYHLENHLEAELPSTWKSDFQVVNSMKEAFEKIEKGLVEGDIVLLSPAAASFGIFKNEFDRGDQFCEIVNSL